MNALTLRVPATSVTFADRRYWPVEEEIVKISAEIHRSILDAIGTEIDDMQTFTVLSKEDLHDFLSANGGKIGFFTAMSGSIQPWMLQAAEYFDYLFLCTGYVKDFLSAQSGNLLLDRNASPATMDLFSVLNQKRERGIRLIRQSQEIRPLWLAIQAVERLKHARLLQIGETEPWIISSDRNTRRFADRFGIQINRIELEELYETYNGISDNEVTDLADSWMKNAVSMYEPMPEHVVQASRVIKSFGKLAGRYNADGIAIACFAMLSALGTTSCLAVSEMNITPGYIGVCEGDLDAAATMLLMKALSDDAPWMGNPVVGKNETIDLVHCTAPRKIRNIPQPYVLRSHHESGIGVSPEVTLPVDEPVTLCRIGRNSTAMSVHIGRAVDTPHEPTCRTQLRIKLPSIDNYLKHSLGNHQVLCYGDYGLSLRYVAELLDLEFLND